jgi:hypothetical protein
MVSGGVFIVISVKIVIKYIAEVAENNDKWGDAGHKRRGLDQIRFTNDLGVRAIFGKVKAAAETFHVIFHRDLAAPLFFCNSQTQRNIWTCNGVAIAVLYAFWVHVCNIATLHVPKTTFIQFFRKCRLNPLQKVTADCLIFRQIN